jgi:hypothetical protein
VKVNVQQLLTKGSIEGPCRPRRPSLRVALTLVMRALLERLESRR